jgi:hypothetical protein
VTSRYLAPHEHKFFTELFSRVKQSIQTIESLHVSLEHDFAALYDLTGDDTFRRA